MTTADPPSRHATARLRHAWVDTSMAPLYVMTYPNQRSLQDVVDAHLVAEDIYTRTDGPLAWIVDASHVTSASAKERLIVAEYEKRIGPVAEVRCAGVGLIIPNAIVRGVYTAIRWVVPARYPFELVANYAQAEDWVRTRLRQATSRAQTRI